MLELLPLAKGRMPMRMNTLIAAAAEGQHARKRSL